MYCSINCSFKISPTSREDGLTAILKRRNSVLGFEPGSLRQNAIALPLAPPTRQTAYYYLFLATMNSSCESKFILAFMFCLLKTDEEFVLKSRKREKLFISLESGL